MFNKKLNINYKKTKVDKHNDNNSNTNLFKIFPLVSIFVT